MTEAGAELDQRVGVFEAAWATGTPNLASFLPPPGDADYLPTLAELVRVDMEFRRKRGETARLERYQIAFPRLFSDRAVVRELAFEEYRLRATAGEPAVPEEYAARYGIDTSGWPPPLLPPSLPTRVLPYEPQESLRPDPRFPVPGDTIDGFHLISELGRGSFGRVYLAEQTGLAGRPVALKLSTRFGAPETETLARLQHTHIVPVYSAHRAGPFQCVVMPFLGAATIADVLADLRAREHWPVSGRDLTDTLLGRRSTALPPSDSPAERREPAPAPARAAPADVVRHTLARYSYSDAVLWIGARLAEALAHAHDRGILHRDVKPANILLTDAGGPMLLDFNLASDDADCTGANRPRVGGTPGYMAPEQLRTMRGEVVQLDGRADVYALGVVLFELLTGRHPFPVAAEETVDPTSLLQLRSDAPPPLRSLNPAVTASAEAIVRRCLEPAPDRRYASAHELAEDLDRQLADLPLKHTREPSVRERARKWVRRHPRMTSATTVVAAAVVVIALLTVALFSRQTHIQRLEAVSAWNSLRREQEPIRSRILGRDLPVGMYAEASDRATAALAPFAALDDSDWADGELIRRLPDTDRAGARRDVALTLTYLADALAWQAARTTEHDRRLELLNRALLANDRARSVSDAGVRTRVRLQRAALLRTIGRPDDAPAGDGSADAAEARAWAALAAGRYREAVNVLEPLAGEPARVFTLWQALGDAHLHLGEIDDAIRCLDVAAALAPDEPAVSFLRGLALLESRRYPAAAAAFDRVLARRRDDPESLLNRAVCRIELGDAAGAIADLDRLESAGTPLPRLYFVRERARQLAGDGTGADRDRAIGIGKEPSDPVGWVARGRARLRQNPPDPKGALADFERAVALDQTLRVGWENLAELLSERLGRSDDAIRALDRALELMPAHRANRAGRAVLHARAGRRIAARADAEACPERGADAIVLYQLGCVYLLTADGPADRERGIALLRACLRADAAWAKFMPTDPDLKSIHGSPEFVALIDAAKTLAR